MENLTAKQTRCLLAQPGFSSICERVFRHIYHLPGTMSGYCAQLPIWSQTIVTALTWRVRSSWPGLSSGYPSRQGLTGARAFYTGRRCSRSSRGSPEWPRPWSAWQPCTSTIPANLRLSSVRSRTGSRTSRGTARRTESNRWWSGSSSGSTWSETVLTDGRLDQVRESRSRRLRLG